MRTLSVVLCLLATGCVHAYREVLPPEAVAQRVKTKDGWELSLVRYPAVGPVRGRPVLLCHGISANSRNLDLDADHSLARWLAAQGRETWSVSLRGTGDSDGVDTEKGRVPGYNFDTLWREDLSAAIQHVRTATGAPLIDFVAHSMGGMLVYAYLSQGGEGLGAIATMGSPTRLDWSGAFDPVLSDFVELAVASDSTVPVITLAYLMFPLQGELEGTPVDTILYNPRNVTARTWKRLLAMGIADMPGGLTQQMVTMLRTGAFGSADGKSDYRKDMRKITNPVLVIAGKSDRVAMPPAVKDGFRALGGPKEWRIIGEVTGAQADYGHMDLVIGERASREVWPHVREFLDRHASFGNAPTAR